MPYSGSPLAFGWLGLGPMNPMPVQAVKIHRPLLRDDTLSRERLTGWLEEAARHRVAIVVGESGFGKTTLLADWSSRTARRTSWYRLETDDRDWLTLLRHLIAGGRELDPAFGADTYRMIGMLGPGGPTQADVVRRLGEEMAHFAGGDPRGFSVILDDYQILDGNRETDPIITNLIEHTAPGFSLVLAARTPPHLPATRVRSRTAIVQMDPDALRFDLPETDRLFRDVYRIPIDPDVLEELVVRTEGWAALLGLVRANLEERPDPDPRALVAQLSATRGDLYDFLAEEVLAHAPANLVDFLIHAAALEEISPESARVVAEHMADAGALLEEAEHRGYLQRAPGRESLRLGSLVREFLYARLRRTRGDAYVQDLHAKVAKRFDGTDWRLAATQYRYAGLAQDAARAIEDSLDEVMGSGEYRVALDLLQTTTEVEVVGAILRSRILLQTGGGDEALAAARLAVDAADRSDRSHIRAAIQNAATIALGSRRIDAAREFAGRAVIEAASPLDRRMAEALLDVIGISGSRSLPAVALRLEHLLASHSRGGQRHYEAITLLNLAQVVIWLDRAPESLRHATRALKLLSDSPNDFERVSAVLTIAQAEAILGRWEEADRGLATALSADHSIGHAEAVLEAAALASWFGPVDLSPRILVRVRRATLPEDWALHWRVVDLWNAGSDVEREQALADLRGDPPLAAEPGAAFRWHLAVARANLQRQAGSDFARALARAEEIADAQGSPVQRRLASLMRLLPEPSANLSALLASSPQADDPLLGVFCAELVARLEDLTPEGSATVTRAARNHPERWRLPLRHSIEESGLNAKEHTAKLLVEIGEASDVAILHAYARRARRASRHWGDILAQRLAPPLVIDDLGLIDLQIGDRKVDGRDIRRRALALLAFLVAQPAGTASPDQVIEAMWPDLAPDAAQNSMHQTIYFLRRVFDPDYRAGMSAEYLHFDSDVVWLDRDLVSCRSWSCRRALARKAEDESSIEQVIELYKGRFAAEFMYEEWASAYRDSLHAQYLGLIERAVRGKLGLLDARWRLWVGQHALHVDPSADGIEAAVIHLYKALGATAAAAEQYEHYASSHRDELGIEPPPLADL